MRNDWNFGRKRAEQGGVGGGGTEGERENENSIRGARERGETAGPEGQADGVSTEPETGEGQEGGEEALAATRVAEAQRQVDEQRDKYLRLAAEFDNYRKRVSRERQEMGARAQGELVTRLLDSLDDLGRVTAVNAEVATAQSIIEGVDAVQKKLMRSLSSAGLEVLDPIDQPFNPELHEAVATERALSPEDDHLVARVYQPGYVFQGQLLRPARVVVKQWAE